MAKSAVLTGLYSSMPCLGASEIGKEAWNKTTFRNNIKFCSQKLLGEQAASKTTPGRRIEMNMHRLCETKPQPQTCISQRSGRKWHHRLETSY